MKYFLNCTSLVYFLLFYNFFVVFFQFNCNCSLQRGVYLHFLLNNGITYQKPLLLNTTVLTWKQKLIRTKKIFQSFEKMAKRASFLADDRIVQTLNYVERTTQNYERESINHNECSPLPPQSKYFQTNLCSNINKSFHDWQASNYRN